MAGTIWSEIDMNTDQLIKEIGGLEATCKLFGWQGGTIHQARIEIIRRLGMVGIVPDKQGVFVNLLYRFTHIRGEP